MTIPFTDFDRRYVDVDGVVIHARVAGSGPAILLLHGYPESSYMWRHVAPALTSDFTVVAADLRGYGESDAPADDADHLTYSRRAMAADQVGLMSALGHERFTVAGHDRGGRVAHRMALDHPERVERVAVLDIVPTLHMFENVDRAMAQSYFHWFFLNQPFDLPERLITADPESRVPHLAFQPDQMSDIPVLPMGEVETSYYLRMRVVDKPGVLADLTRIFAKASISIDAMVQKEPGEGESRVDIVLLTHKAVEKNVNGAIAKIEKLKSVVGKVTRIRLEELL